jgi:hypothetical protein
LNDSELQKHKKVTDILGFVKSGNLTMVHNLIRYHKLGMAILTVKGFAEEFQMTKTEKVSMAEWNPLLLAIAFKRLDIVRYFSSELKISVRHGSSKPGDLTQLNSSERVEAEIFGLLLTIANKDAAMFSELLTTNYTAWEQTHVDSLLRHLIEAKWNQGLTALFKSYTTETLFASTNTRR